MTRIDEGGRGEAVETNGKKVRSELRCKDMIRNEIAKREALQEIPETIRRVPQRVIRKPE